MKKGFTLIELLVVVLIIGILAAIALPQYTKSVKKVRAQETIVLAKSILQAEEEYFLTNGTYTRCINELNFDYEKFTVEESSNGCIWSVSEGTGNRKKTIIIYDYIGYLPVNNNWKVNVMLGNFGFSGNGGFGERLGNSEPEQQPFSCIEYACHTVEEGSFCRKIMGYKTMKKESDCWRYYN